MGRIECNTIRKPSVHLPYEAVTGQWMIPGSGLEDDETERECCMREIAEDTVKIVEVSEWYVFKGIYGINGAYLARKNFRLSYK